MEARIRIELSTDTLPRLLIIPENAETVIASVTLRSEAAIDACNQLLEAARPFAKLAVDAKEVRREP